MTIKVAFLGLGVMGAPMAGHLVQAGYRVIGYNRTDAKAQAWADRTGAAVAATPAAAVAGADLVFACVGADADVRAVCTGSDGAFSAMKAGAVFVDHTTTSAALAQEMAAAAEAAGLGFVDAPVSGGQAGAEAGQLTVMCGGTEAAFGAAEQAMGAYGKMVRRLGPAGSGQTAKMVNQVCIAGLLQGLAEALQLCMAAGLEPEEVVSLISQGAAQSWQMDNRAHTMTAGAFDFGFAVDWMRKDLGIVLDEAKRLGVSLPVTALVDQFYADVQAMGGGRQDTSSLIRRFRG